MPVKSLCAGLLCVAGLCQAAPVTALPPAPVAGHPAILPQTAPPPSPTPAVSGSHFDLARLEQIQSETLILEAQAARAKAERAAGGSSDDSSPAPALAMSTASGLPRIAEIAGSGRLSATLVMPDNSQVQVSAGQAISGTGLTVSRITAQSVIVRRRDGTTLSLPMDD